MQPHANLGIRLRSVRNKGFPLEHVGTSGGKGLAMGTEMAIRIMLSNIGMDIIRIPFWKKLYRQGRRG